MSRARRSLIAWGIIVLLIALVAGYAGLKRSTTRANVEIIEFFPNRDGGFVAIGHSTSQPGFLLMSTIDGDEVTVSANQFNSPAAGTFTKVDVATGSDKTQIELRDPVLILIDGVGKIETVNASWNHDDFTALRRAVDCKINGSARCESPFADLADLLQTWPQTQSTERAQSFLSDRLEHRQ